MQLSNFWQKIKRFFCCLWCPIRRKKQNLFCDSWTMTSSNDVYSFWNEPGEDIYTLNDGEPIKWL